MTYHVIMACHNRRETTLACLRSLENAFANVTEECRTVLFDDGSSDGTSDAVAEEFPEVVVKHGDGTAFWARSMSLALQSALPEMARGDCLIWLNDDVLLDEDSILRVTGIRRELKGRSARFTCLVGAVRDPQENQISYSGLARSGWHPLSFRLVLPTDSIQAVDSFNGNFAVFPLELVREVGDIDSGFSHAFADIDYGLRVRAVGGETLLMPGTFGACPGNTEVKSLTSSNWRAFTGVKGGGHRASVKRFVNKHEPAKWPIAYGLTVVAWWVRRMVRWR